MQVTRGYPTTRHEASRPVIRKSDNLFHGLILPPEFHTVLHPLSGIYRQITLFQLVALCFDKNCHTRVTAQDLCKSRAAIADKSQA